MNDISLLHIALIYLVIIRSSFARLLPKGRKNVVTFFVYGIDKRRSTSGRLLPARLCRFARRRTGRKKAKQSKWRVPEAALLGLAVVGGSIGAWLGMKTWHHKTLHKKFKYGIPAIIIVQLLITGYILFR